jgi:Uma2 family endonuclease
MLPPHRVWTREQVLALPDDGYRYELIDGKLYVSPTARAHHQRALMALIRVLDPYIEEHRIGELLPSPSDLDLFDGQRLQPDLFVIPYRDGERFSDWPDAGIPLLVVEVADYETVRADRGEKRIRYLESGVPVYWVVDHEEARVQVWTPDSDRPTVEAKRLVWRPLPQHPPLELDVVALYERLFGGM